jgi:hypothetical protein
LLDYCRAPKGLNVRYVSKPVILILNSNAQGISKRYNPILFIVNSITKVTGRSFKAGAVAALIVLPCRGNAINRLPEALAVCVSDCVHEQKNVLMNCFFASIGLNPKNDFL